MVQTSRDFEIKRGMGLKKGDRTFSTPPGLCLLFRTLEVECPGDIFKQQELVHLKVTFIVTAVSSWLADIQVLSKKGTQKTQPGCPVERTWGKERGRDKW